MAQQPPKTAITTAKNAHSTIKSLSNQCQIVNKIAFFQITTLKHSIVENNNSIIKNMASEIADRYFNNNFIEMSQKFRYVTGDFLQSIDITDVYNRANTTNTNFLQIIFILDRGSNLQNAQFLKKPFSQYMDIFYGGQAVK